jgi:S1-C subfamily serine protease
MRMRWLGWVVVSVALVGGSVGAASAQNSPSIQPRQISFAKMAVRIPAGTPWAHLQFLSFPFPCRDYKILTWDAKANESFQDPELERVFRAELSQAGVSVAGDPTNLFETDQKASDLQIGALVTGLKAQFCYQQTFKDVLTSTDRVITSGTATMNIEWQIYSTVEARVIARIPTSGTYLTKEAIDAGRVVILQRAFADAVRNLVTTEAFRAAIADSTIASGVSPLPPLNILSATSTAAQSATEASAGVAVIFAGQAMGSAFLISRDGYLLTNHHVVGEATRVRVRWADKSETVGEVVRSDRRRDVALVKADAKGRAPLTLRQEDVRPGETVFAIGTPLDKDFQNTVTRGVVSARREYEGQSFIQCVVAVDHGNSGGPLLDEKGRVVGITEWVFAPDGVSHNLNFFIPIADALRALALKPSA